MKEIKDMSIEELAAIAGDKSIPVPENLRTDISATLDTLELVGSRRNGHVRRLVTVCSIAASIALCAFAGMELIGQEPRPKDTFEDPYLAYAQLEKAFDLISTKMQDVTETTISNDSQTNN